MKANATGTSPMDVPNELLEKLYTLGSLRNTDNGAQFALKNWLSDAEVTGLGGILIDGKPVALDQVRMDLADRRPFTAAQLDAEHPILFPLRSTVMIHAGLPKLGSGRHEIEITFEARPFGKLHLKIEDALAEEAAQETRMPRDEANDYNPEVILQRRNLIEQVSGVKLHLPTGQNIVGRATYASYNWILEHYKGIEKSYLESNFATDKKASHVNIMRTRGKRVTAEATITREVMQQYLRIKPEQLTHHYGVANIGAFLSGATSNAAQSANGIAAMFIATGQDVANVAESSAGILYTELTEKRDLYISLTIPSLIVATYGGGTGLPTQRECLEILGCYGKGKVNRLAEIIAAVALAGEISLAAAISSSDWVSSHEKLGRNR